MYVEMVCSCEATLHLDMGEEDGAIDSIWMLTYRFANAHIHCGYMTPGTSPEAEEVTKKRAGKPRRTPEEDQE